MIVGKDQPGDVDEEVMLVRFVVFFSVIEGPRLCGDDVEMMVSEAEATHLNVVF